MSIVKKISMLIKKVPFLHKSVKWVFYFFFSPKKIYQLLNENELLKARVERLEASLINNESGINRLTMALEMQEEKITVASSAGNDGKKSIVVASSGEKSNKSLDMVYTQFEDEFRGTVDQIKQRQIAYLPFLKDKLNKKTKILDLGCGRGEWLELLVKEGVQVAGVDTNSFMVKECKRKGLDVVEMDGIAFLSGKVENTYDVVTGFHIVEHIPAVLLMKLFSEVYRTLKPGGVAIFETPNPENILVGSCTFYLDFTHQNPIPPQTLEFLMRKRGFTETQIVRTSPLSFAESKGMDNIKNIVDRFNIGQDYAVIARKQGVRGD